jgi:hypothetical protein
VKAGDGLKHRDVPAMEQLGERLSSLIMQRIFNEARRRKDNTSLQFFNWRNVSHGEYNKIYSNEKQAI